jgi:hypothetical protein
MTTKPAAVSAEILPFPDRVYRPDFDALRAILGDEQHPAMLWQLIMIAVDQVEKRRQARTMTNGGEQAVMNALALIHAASGRMIGHEVLS